MSTEGENEYHTLASVAGAPQSALMVTSSSSVVASVVSTVTANGMPGMATAPVKVSLVGAAASAGVAKIMVKSSTALLGMAMRFT